MMLCTTTYNRAIGNCPLYEKFNCEGSGVLEWERLHAPYFIYGRFHDRLA